MKPSFQIQLEEIKEADILIGIPSYNNSRTIGHVVRAVMAGLAKYFPGAKAVIINSDGGSTDGTQEEVRRVQIEDYKTILTSHPVHPIQKIVTPYHGIPGKGSSFRAIFETTQILNAKACAVVDSDLRSITPEWMDLLLTPIYEEGFDYVAPLYARHKFDGTITNSIVYPLTRTLYGKRVRQPIGGDFGFSGKLAKFYLTKDVWETDVARFGIDIWMTTLAIAEGYKVCQSYLGAKIHDAKDPGSDLGPMFTQVVSSVYGLMGNYQPLWKGVKESQPVSTFGFHYEVGLEPVPVNLGRMIGNFRLGVKDLMEIWRKVLLPETVLWLESIGRLSDEAFSFPQDLWVRLIYDFAIAYHKGSVHREHLLKSMIPLYLGRVASFVKENQESSVKEVEEKIESLCKVFEEMKPYLIERWG
ncbi:MAG: glycosyl transferase family 2 [Thermodesulfobacteriota bacterium]|nr:glycosyl transferase family 2 [Thermodesulfobacteriota bacterium]